MPLSSNPECEFELATGRFVHTCGAAPYSMLHGKYLCAEHYLYAVELADRHHFSRPRLSFTEYWKRAFYKGLKRPWLRA